MARGTIAGSEGGNLCAASGATGSHPIDATRQVPAIGYRVAQTSALLLLEPIFEADLQPAPCMLTGRSGVRMMR